MQTFAKLNKKREDTNSRNKGEASTTDSIDTKNIIKEYYKHLYIHKLDNLD